LVIFALIFGYFSQAPAVSQFPSTALLHSNYNPNTPKPKRVFEVGRRCVEKQKRHVRNEISFLGDGSKSH